MAASEILQDTPLAFIPGRNLSLPFLDTMSQPWSILSLLPSTLNRVPFTTRHFVTEIIPILLGFFALTVLVQLPDTKTLRLGIMSAVLTLAYHVCTTADIAVNLGGGRMLFTNFGFCAGMICMCMRVVEFGTANAPYRRTQYSMRDPKAPQYITPPFFALILDAFDLCFNERGIGWNWGKSCYLPPRPQTSSTRLCLDSLLMAVQMFVISDFAVFAQQSFILHPSTRPTIAPAGTILDPTMALPSRYGKAVLMTFIYAFQLSATFVWGYSLGTILGVGVFQQSPAQWPPLFDAPWLATSVADFWGKRWQQVFKRSFVICGAKPAARLLGRPGGVLGAFLVSGLMHDLGMWGMGAGAEPTFMTGGFLLMGVGTLVEAGFERVTGRKVGGALGWCWTLWWVLTAGIPITDALARRGFFESAMNPGDFRPAVLWIDVIKRWQTLHGA